MEMKVVILGVNNWEFEENKGTSIFYVGTTPDYEDGKNGLFPVKKTIKGDIAAAVNKLKLPCLCNLKFNMKTTAGGRMDLDILNVELIKALKFD